MIEDYKEFRGGFEGDVLNEAEAAGEWGDGEGGVDGEGPFKDVEPD